MKRLMVAAVTAAAMFILPAAFANAQLTPDAPAKGARSSRTDDGLKADAEIDKLYRSKVGQTAPEVKADPWADVRTPAAEPARKPKKH